MKRFTINRFITALSFLGIFTLSTSVYASAFQLFEQDAGTMGENHSGYAAKAEDATTAWYNPAGITRLTNQQLVFGGLAVTPSFKFNGIVRVNSINNFNTPLPATAQGGAFAFIPFLHYVAPLTERLGFGLSVDAPFGLKTSYGRSSALRYAATLSAVTVVDISPVLAYQFNDQWSFGAGPDIQRMYGEFDQVGTNAGLLDAQAINKANDTAYGYHAGLLYQQSPQTRFGLSYHSQVVHHLKGNSRFSGPLAAFFSPADFYSSDLNGRLTLPAYTALSVYHKLNPCVVLMGTAAFTQWTVFKALTFNNLAGLDANLDPSTTIQVTIPQHYRNTWNFSFGSNYAVRDNMILKAGLGFDETPVQDKYRNVQLPDTNRFILSLGGHFQATKTLGVDFSWLHVFVRSTHVNPVEQTTGAQVTRTDGTVRGGADLIGAQVVWDI